MIRPARPTDTAAVRAIAEAAYARYVPRIGRRPAPMDADLAGQIAQGLVYVWDDGGLCGYVTFWPEGRALVLDAVGVAPEAAGRGLGRALIGYVEQQAARQGLDRVALYTNAAMVENLGMYPHLGYVQVGRRMMDGFDRVFFEKTVQARSTSTDPTE